MNRGSQAIAPSFSPHGEHFDVPRAAAGDAAGLCAFGGEVQLVAESPEVNRPSRRPTASGFRGRWKLRNSGRPFVGNHPADAQSPYPALAAAWILAS